jgi:predicted DNA binding protein
MKSVSVALTPAPEMRHPMHAFVIAHDGYEMSRLLEMNLLDDGHWTSLFHVVGSPLEPYEAALQAADTVVEYEISTRPDDSFFLYVRNAPSEIDQGIIAAARQRGLVTAGPVEFRSDGTIRLTMVAPGEAVQQALDEMPGDIGVAIRSIGEYNARHFATDSALTERQYEAVAAAVDCGYYEEPRSGSVAEVATELDCASGTAAELLRRAEATVMADVVSGDPSPVE